VVWAGAGDGKRGGSLDPHGLRPPRPQCHPDFMGDAGHNICILLNEAYEVRPPRPPRCAVAPGNG
jgi:hypothetical protein